MWILVLLQLNNGTPDVFPLEIYQTKEACLIDLTDITPRLKPNEAMVCMTQEGGVERGYD